MPYECHTFSLQKSYGGRRAQKANANPDPSAGIIIPENMGDLIQFFGVPVLGQCSSVGREAVPWACECQVAVPVLAP